MNHELFTRQCRRVLMLAVLCIALSIGYSSSVSAQSPPPAPSLTVTAGCSEAFLSWTASSGATSYNVKRSTSSTGPFTVIASVTTTGYTDTGLTNGQQYCYIVNAVNAFGQSGNSNEVCVTPCCTPPRPMDLTATPGCSRVILTWIATTGTISYKVKRSKTSGGPYTTIASGVTATTYTDTGVVNGTTYYYVIDATNGCGDSPNSNQASAKPSCLGG